MKVDFSEQSNLQKLNLIILSARKDDINLIILLGELPFISLYLSPSYQTESNYFSTSIKIVPPFHLLLLALLNIFMYGVINLQDNSRALGRHSMCPVAACGCRTASGNRIKLHFHVSGKRVRQTHAGTEIPSYVIIFIAEFPRTLLE